MSQAAYDFVRYYGAGGMVHAVRRRGRKLNHLVVLDHPITIVEVSHEEDAHITSIERDLRPAVNRFLDAAKRCGITEGARRLLQEALASL